MVETAGSLRNRISLCTLDHFVVWLACRQAGISIAEEPILRTLTLTDAAKAGQWSAKRKLTCARCSPCAIVKTLRWLCRLWSLNVRHEKLWLTFLRTLKYVFSFFESQVELYYITIFGKNLLIYVFTRKVLLSLGTLKVIYLSVTLTWLTVEKCSIPRCNSGNFVLAISSSGRRFTDALSSMGLRLPPSSRHSNNLFSITRFLNTHGGQLPLSLSWDPLTQYLQPQMFPQQSTLCLVSFFVDNEALRL